MFATVLGLGFSIAVILSNMGIMDGFEFLLSKGLRKTQGEISFYNTTGFFSKDDFESTIKQMQVEEFTGIVKTHGFIVVEQDNPKGVEVRGVDPKSFKSLTGLEISVSEGKVVLGDILAKNLGVNAGDEVALTFADGNAVIEGLPETRRYEVQALVHHGVYQLDQRYVYMEMSELASILGVKDRFNSVILNIPKAFVSDSGQATKDEIEKFKNLLASELSGDFLVKGFWDDFESLLEAVEHEKFYLNVILQLIVIVSIFNMLAFFIYLNEKKAKDIFLLKALGMGQKMFSHFWYTLIFLFWILSSLTGLGLTYFFDFALGHFSIFKMPGSIYHLERLSIELTWQGIILVLGLTFVWMQVISYFGLRKIASQSALRGLRKEFD